jgi:uncharacterized protein with GYD domain
VLTQDDPVSTPMAGLHAAVHKFGRNDTAPGPAPSALLHVRSALAIGALEDRALSAAPALSYPRENTMNRRDLLGLSAIAMMGFALLPGNAIAQQAGPTMHKYFIRAVLTSEGVKNLQKQPATALRAGVAKFAEAAGGKMEFWYFDYTENTAYSTINYPDEISAATTQLASNAAGFARVTIRPVLSAEDVDKALAKANTIRPPQQQ